MTKKFYAILLAVVLTAGYARAQFAFGVRAGFNLTNMSQKIDGKKPDKDRSGNFLPGFQFGVAGEYAVSDHFALQPAILFATQGAKYGWSETEDGATADVKTSTHLNYIQIPVNLQYKLDLSGIKLLLQAGPYFAFGISGKEKYEAAYKGESESNDTDINFGCKSCETKRVDAGLSAGAGVQFGNFQVGLGYNFGLMNISNADKIKLKNNGLYLSTTYLFY